MSNLSLLLSLAGLGLFGYSAYYMNYNPKADQMHSLLPPALKEFGHLKFLTYQCLCIQVLNSLLHVGSHFFGFLKGPRDVVFSSLAYPVGSLVVYTFWAVWHIMGRELIFPQALDQFYPAWLNHATHSIIVPLNLMLAYLEPHRYSSTNLSICLLYFAIYVGFLHYIKFKSGLFVYRYLDTMDDTQRIIYFAGTAIFAFMMYKTGEYLNALAHGKPTQRPQLKKKQK